MKRIAVDVDGVLANLMDPLLEFSNPIYGTNFTREDIFVFDFKQIFNITREEEARLFSDFSGSCFFNKIKPISGSQEAISYLSQKNHLAVITARADYIQDQTYNWLNNFFPIVFSEVHFARNLYLREGAKPNKSDFCLGNGYEIIIEDDLNYANLCAEKGIDSILLNYRWNRDGKLHSKVKRAKNWDEVLEILK